MNPQTIELRVERELRGRDRFTTFLAAWRTKRILRKVGQKAHIIRTNSLTGQNENNRLRADHFLRDRNTERTDQNVDIDQLEQTFTSQQLAVQRGNSLVDSGIFGYSIEPFGNSIVSIGEIREQAGRIGVIALSKLAAYTAVHEIGHLLGLVTEEQSRYQNGQHCANECVMGTTRTPEETRGRIRSMGNRILFCSDCRTDLAQLPQRPMLQVA